LIGGQLLAPLARDQAHQSRPVLRPPRVANHAGYFVVLAIYFLLPPCANIPKCHRPLWKFLLSVQTSRFMAGPLSHMPGRSRSRINSIWRYLSFALSLLASRARHHHSMPDCYCGIGLRAFLAAQIHQLMAAAYRSAAFKRGLLSN